MKYSVYCILLIPIIFTFFAVMGCGFFFRAAVSASCAGILWLFPDKTIGRSVLWIIAALLVSIGGDWFMSHIGNIPVRFIYGICLFFVAHMGFLYFCLKNGHVDWQVLLTVLAGYLVFFFVMLFPAIAQTPLLIAVLMYLLISCFTLSAAVGSTLPGKTRWGFTLGIALLVFSDTIIALKVFAGHHELDFLILPTYFASHIMITFALMRKAAVSAHAYFQAM